MAAVRSYTCLVSSDVQLAAVKTVDCLTPVYRIKVQFSVTSAHFNVALDVSSHQLQTYSGLALYVM